MKYIRIQSAMTFIILSAVAVLPFSSVLPCGPGEPDPNMLFTPKRFSSVVYRAGGSTAFYPFSNLEADSPDRYCTIELPARNDENLKHWRDSVKTKVSYDALSDLVYKMPLDDLKKAKKSGKSSNSALQALLKGKASASVDYLIYAKEVQPVVSWSPDYWYSDNEPPEGETYYRYQTEALKRASQTNDRNLKIRYLFQALRLAHYSHSYTTAISIYNKNLKDVKPNDPLYERIQAIYAGALIKTGNIPDALLLYSRVFFDDPYLQENILTDFRKYADEKTVSAAYAKAKNREEKTRILTLHSLSSFSPLLTNMERIAKEGIVDERLSYLLLKDVERLELRALEEIFSQAYKDRNSAVAVLRRNSAESGASTTGKSFFETFFGAVIDFFSGPFKSLHAAEKDPVKGLTREETEYIKKLDGFVTRMSRKEETKNKELWILASAYLKMLTGNTGQSLSLLKDARIQSSSHPFIRNQSRQIHLLNAVLHNESMNDTVKSAVQNHYEVFENQNEGLSEGGYINRGARTLVNYRMVVLHSRENKPGLALLFENDFTDPYDESSTFVYPLGALQNALQVLEKPDSEYEKFLSESAGEGRKLLLYDRIGGRAIAAGKPELAVRSFSRLPQKELDSMVREYTGSFGPFENRFLEPGGGRKPAEFWNKKNIAEKLLKISKQNDPEANYRTGLLYFNTSHYGKWWIVTKPYKSMYYRYSEKGSDPQLQLASGYFQKTIDSGASDELKAASHYMLAFISYLQANEAGYYNYGVKITDEQKKHFRTLESKYQDTDFFIKVVDSCSYYRLAKK